MRGIGVVSDPPGKRACARTTTAPVASAARRRRGRSRSRRDELAETSPGDASADVHDAQHPGASPPGREGARAGAAFETETARLASRETAPRGGSSPPPPPRDEEEECPLCCTALDATDRRFKPCACGYQLCAWCWHQIMEQANALDKIGKCPACRAEYDESSIRFDAPSEEELLAETRKKDPQKNQNLPSERDAFDVSSASSSRSSVDAAKSSDESRRGKNKFSELHPRKQNVTHASNDPSFRGARGVSLSAAERRRLFDVRVIRRNLVYVVGLTPRFCKEAPLRETRIFQKFGEVLKIHATPPKPNAALVTGSAYVTFLDEAAAARCIRGVDNTTLDGKTLRASFGTTKYCTSFLKGQTCMNQNCLYLHDGGVPARDSFTKEEMLAQYGSKNTRAFHNAAQLGGVQTHDAAFAAPNAGREAGIDFTRAFGGDSRAEMRKQKNDGFSRGAYVEPRSVSRSSRNRAATGIKGGIPAPRPIPGITNGTGNGTGSAADKSSSPSDLSGGLNVFGAGKTQPPAPLGEAAPREKSRFNFAAEHDA